MQGLRQLFSSAKPSSNAVNNEPVHVIGVNKTYSNAQKFASKVKQLADRYAGKPLVILFPESVLGKKPLARSEGKKLARQLHEIASSHGNLHIAYSSLEHTHNRFLSNSGYLIAPRKVANPRKSSGLLGYQVYPKLTTYDNGRDVTDYDTARIARNVKSFHGGDPFVYAAHLDKIYRRSLKCLIFPRLLSKETLCS